MQPFKIGNGVAKGMGKRARESRCESWSNPSKKISLPTKILSWQLLPLS